MSVSLKHVLEQGPVLRALGTAAVSAIRSRNRDTAIPATPGPWIEETVQPRSPELIRDYLRNIGADPSWYRGRLPAHLFPQWGFPFAARAIAKLPYPLTRVLNAGCRIEINHHLKDNEPFIVRARLESIDDDGRRALITTKIVSETVEKPEAIVSELRAYVPLGKPQGTSPRSSKPTVPTEVREIAFLRINADAGLDFAKLTGDFNPIHWIPAAARAAGFKGCILHGFATLSRSIAALDRAVFAGDSTRLKSIDARFTRPLPLPAKVGVYTRENQLWVGDAPGGGAYLEATWEPQGASPRSSES